MRNLTIIGSDNGMSPCRHQAIIWANAGISLIGPWNNLSEIFIEIHTLSLKKMHLKMTLESGGYLSRPQCVKAHASNASVGTMMPSSNGNIFRVTGHLCGNSPVLGEFPSQRPVMRSFDVFFDLRLNKRLSKQSWGWCSETLSSPLWRHSNDINRLCFSKTSRDILNIDKHLFKYKRRYHNEILHMPS